MPTAQANELDQERIASGGAPLVQVNLVVTNLERSRRFYQEIGWELAPMGELAARVDLDGITVAFHLPAFAHRWNRSYIGGTGGTAVLDVRLPCMAEVDRVHAALLARDARSRQAPGETFWGEYYAIVEDPDGYAIGLKSPLA